MAIEDILSQFENVNLEKNQKLALEALSQAATTSANAEIEAEQMRVDFYSMKSNVETTLVDVNTNINLSNLGNSYTSNVYASVSRNHASVLAELSNLSANVLNTTQDVSNLRSVVMDNHDETILTLDEHDARFDYLYDRLNTVLLNQEDAKISFQALTNRLQMIQDEQANIVSILNVLNSGSAT